MKIAILGSAPSKADAPFGAPDWNIWACSPDNLDLPRWDEWFEVHTYPGCVTLYPFYLDHLRGAGGRPVWMAAPLAEIPAARRFDHARLVAEFGPNFFTSSIAWMLAEAIVRGATTIALFGVEMAQGGEYATQRGGCLHFAEQARMRGIQMLVHPDSALLKGARLYGVAEPSGLEADIARRKELLAQRLDEAVRRRARLEEEIAQCRGAIAAHAETLRLHFGVF